MRISASLYSNKAKPISSIIKELEQCHIDYVHIDCINDLSVFEDIKFIKNNHNILIDLHIIAEDPLPLMKSAEELQVDYCSIQYENCIDKKSWADFRFTHTELGLAIKTDTSIDVFDYYQHICKYILIMSTIPGQSGGSFVPSNFQKIRQFKKRFPYHTLQVDGGVNAEVSFILRNMNVDCIVSGNYLMNADSIAIALNNLKYDNVASHFYVRDFMIPLTETPYLYKDATTLQALICIEKYKLGFCAIIDHDLQLQGIISNADLRRAMIYYLQNNANNITLDQMLNRTPITILDHMNVTEMLNYIKKQKIPILFLPVINTNNQLCGTITFNNLIKSEL